VFKAKLHGKEEVAVKVFKLSARIKSEVRLSTSCAQSVMCLYHGMGGRQ
jgi:hypothetical protein